MIALYLQHLGRANRPTHAITATESEWILRDRVHVDGSRCPVSPDREHQLRRETPDDAERCVFCGQPDMEKEERR